MRYWVITNCNQEYNKPGRCTTNEQAAIDNTLFFAGERLDSITLKRGKYYYDSHLLEVTEEEYILAILTGERVYEEEQEEGRRMEANGGVSQRLARAKRASQQRG